MAEKKVDLLDKVAEFYEDLNRENILLVHHGEVTQDILRSLLSLTKEQFKRSKDIKKVVKKRVFNIMIECVQNIKRHADDVPDEKLASSIFMIGLVDDDYFIVSGNILSKKNVEFLDTQLTKINGLDKDGLDKLYYDVIRNGHINERGGAGLGFVDMARRSGQNFEFHFDEMDDKYCFFTFQTRVKILTKEEE